MNNLTFKFNMESFYFSTHLPISAFSLTGDEFHSVGYNEISCSIQKNIVIDEIIKDISKNKSSSHIDISPIDDVYFTICSINSSSYEEGFYIVGPYKINADSKSNAIFKPKHCIIHLLNLLYINVSNSQETESNKTSYNLNVNKAIKYIEANYKKPITLDEVCENININKSYLCTIFKEHTSKTFSHYLSHYRIDRSKELLKNTDLSITEIALTVGYNSVNYFNNNFKRLTDMTPAQYRNRQ